MHHHRVLPSEPPLGTGHTQTPIFNTKRSNIKQDTETGWLNLNQTETAASGSAGVDFKEKKEF